MMTMIKEECRRGRRNGKGSRCTQRSYLKEKVAPPV
jgi:hypothetical protein